MKSSFQNTCIPVLLPSSTRIDKASIEQSRGHEDQTPKNGASSILKHNNPCSPKAKGIILSKAALPSGVLGLGNASFPCFRHLARKVTSVGGCIYLPPYSRLTEYLPVNRRVWRKRNRLW